MKRALSITLIATCSLPSLAQEMHVELKGCLTSETTILDRAGDTVIGMTVTRGVTDRVGAGSFPAHQPERLGLLLERQGQLHDPQDVTHPYTTPAMPAMAPAAITHSGLRRVPMATPSATSASA